MHTLYLTPPHHPSYIFQTNCPTLTHHLHLLYGSYLTTTPVSASRILTAIRKDDSYEIRYSDIRLTTPHPLRAIEDILYEHQTFPPGIFALHGAAISHSDQAHLFLAATTGGKTTLTVYLVSRGFGYITDDCILLDRHDYTIHPYTTPLHLRKGGLDVLRQYAALPESLETLEDADFTRYVYTPTVCVTTSLPLGRIFFITRTDSENRLEEMPVTERMTALLKSPVIEYPMSSSYLQFIAELAQFPCYQLFYRDMGYVQEVIQNG